MTKRVLSIIPARGGSKGLPRKNIIDLAGKPLIAWTIEASLNSKYITKTIVSSDDEEILDISEEYGAVIIKRPDNLASDVATSESVVRHAIDYLESMGEIFDIVVLLQPTSPLRGYKDIDNAFKIMLDSGAMSVISVYECDNKILKSFLMAPDGIMRAVNNDKYPFMRRQDLPKTYMPNGAIYMINTKIFKETGSFMANKTLSYRMPRDRSEDIDSLRDLNNAAKVLIKKPNND
jgi:CMP-N,N'-diacetyllegionaminic acid synthase